MQIMVSVNVHELQDYSHHVTALTAFFTMVHIVDGKPTAVPRLNPVTEDEKEIYWKGEQKYLQIKAKKKQ